MNRTVTEIRRHLNLKHLDAVIWTYNRLDYSIPEQKALENKTQRGMALFQYDPQGHEGGPAWRLYYEHVCYHNSKPNNQC